MNPDLKFMQEGEIRTRIAPSPTGFLHIGTARTALFNYLFAKKYRGSFILRIEDTDVERSKPEYEKNIVDSLKWLGIDWDEGPDIGGKCGPYRQSERILVYKKYLEKLVEENKAYYCFCSQEELETQRQYQMSRGQAPRYSGKCRQLPESEIKQNLAQGKEYVIRFKISPQIVAFEDLIRGKIEFDTSLMGDVVIAKNFSAPLYNFAVVIDDFEMKISHVIRGEDHISNTPKQILMQEALGLPNRKYAHLPLILGPDKSRLSKRHGAVSVEEYKKEGYFAETLINFIAFLGWNPGTDKEIFSLPALIKEFSLEKCQKAGAAFNIKRLEYLNGFYVRHKPIEKLTELCLPYLIEAGFVEETEEKNQLKITATGEMIYFEYIKNIALMYQERLKKLSEITELTDFFFKNKLGYNKDLLRWKGMPDREIQDSLGVAENILSKMSFVDWNKEKLAETLLAEADKIGDKGRLLWPLRAALTGKEASAGPFEVAEILGKEKVLNRIQQAKSLLGT